MRGLGLQVVSRARYVDRRLIEAAEEILAEAGRPMHAAEIWERLAARGLTLPGHDPVAALNTRLWKRAPGGGTFRRLRDAAPLRQCRVQAPLQCRAPRPLRLRLCRQLLQSPRPRLCLQQRLNPIP